MLRSKRSHRRRFVRADARALELRGAELPLNPPWSVVGHRLGRETSPQARRCECRSDRAVARRCARRNVGSAEVCSGIRASGHSKTRKDTPALPFCQRPISTRKPKDSKCPVAMKTVGDRIRKKRLDCGLTQKQLARMLRVNEMTIANWELNHTSPLSRLIAKINRFLSG